jgi:hypothetical protein
MIARFDYVFSFWLYFWYILFELKITKYNPKFGLQIAVFVNLIIIISMFYYKNDIINIILFILINTIIKIIPLWRLRNTKYNDKDKSFLYILFIVYIFWLQYNSLRIQDFTFWDNIKNNKPFSPVITTMYSLLNKEN